MHLQEGRSYVTFSGLITPPVRSLGYSTIHRSEMFSVATLRWRSDGSIVGDAPMQCGLIHPLTIVAEATENSAVHGARNFSNRHDNHGSCNTLVDRVVSASDGVLDHYTAKKIVDVISNPQSHRDHTSKPEADHLVKQALKDAKAKLTAIVGDSGVPESVINALRALGIR